MRKKEEEKWSNVAIDEMVYCTENKNNEARNVPLDRQNNAEHLKILLDSIVLHCAKRDVFR